MSVEPPWTTINRQMETEANLGPLPDGWERVPDPSTNRYFFMDHNNQKTTWIDPRTKRLRKASHLEITPLELPYGWEEAWEPGIGIYFIDHNTKTHHFEGPWHPVTQANIAKAKNEGVDYIDQEEKRVRTASVHSEKMVDLEAHKKKVVDEVREREMAAHPLGEEEERSRAASVREEETADVEPVTPPAAVQKNHDEAEETLFNAKAKLDLDTLELTRLKTSNKVLDDAAANTRQHLSGVDYTLDSVHTEAAQLKDAQNEASRVRDAVETEFAEHEGIRDRLHKLKEDVVQMVGAGEEKTDVWKQAEKDSGMRVSREELVGEGNAPAREQISSDEQKELGALKDELARERSQELPQVPVGAAPVLEERAALSSTEKLDRASVTGTENVPAPPPPPAPVDDTPVGSSERLGRASSAGRASVAGRTSIVRKEEPAHYQLTPEEIEGSVFRPSVTEAERPSVTDSEEAEIGGIGLHALPKWVKDLTAQAENSKTLRVKIAKKAEASPDRLNFKDKLLKFTAASIEAGETGVMPKPIGASKAERAVKARETFFGTNMREMPEDGQEEEEDESEEVIPEPEEPGIADEVLAKLRTQQEAQ
ncbi:hypothetical protein HK104_001995 [Borealophlyctis nickersoniae]|nr:hypothetical protein HK104_001995 [Borealophlyctis nickersoniae]